VVRARSFAQGQRVRVSATGGGGGQRAEHPLLELQRTAGNRAVAQLVQRRVKPEFSSSKVAIAPMAAIYAGKCDAKLEGASVRKKWSRGLTGKDKALIFECGPQSFRFETFRGWFDDDSFPWTLDLADGSSAWLDESITRALEDIWDDIDDPGPKFWSGYHTITAALASDLRSYCDER
jgi:hypothetical protein